MKKTIHLLISALALAAAVNAGNAQRLRGNITISGAWAIYPLVTEWAQEFSRLNPGVRIDVSAGGAGKGMADALSGAVDIGMVSREIDPSEAKRGAFAIFIAKDAVFPTVSAANPALSQLLARGVKKSALVGIWITGKVTDWRQAAGGRNFAIHVYTRSDSCGAAQAWAAFLGRYRQENLRGIGVYGDPGLLETVRRDSLGIGFNNLSYVFSGEKVVPGIRLLPIDANGNGKADPDELIQTRGQAHRLIASEKYPATRREYLVTRGKPTGVVREFIKWTLGPQGTSVLNRVGGYVPLTELQAKTVLSTLR